MKFLLILFVLLPSFCSAGMIINPYNVVTSSGSSYDYFDETAENTGSDETWTDTTGTVNVDYTTSPISGSQSIALDDGSTTTNEVTSPTASSVTEGYFSAAFQASNITSYPTDRFISFLDSSDNVIAEFRLFSSMTQIYTYYLDSTLQVGAAESYDTSGGAVVYIGLHYTAGSGTAEYEFWVSSTALGSSWGTADQTYSSKTSTAGIAKIKLYRDSSSAVIYKYDDITGASTQVAR